MDHLKSKQTKEITKHVTSLGLATIGIVIITFIFIIPIGGFFSLEKLLNLQGFINLRPDHLEKNTLHVEGIREEVTIIRDNWGVPHIYSKYDTDVLFGLGICHAQDRLWQMDVITRTGMGLMSEIMGNSSLEDDIYFLKIGILDAALRILEKIDQDRKTEIIINDIMLRLEAYCNGVNFIINDLMRSNRLPLEFQLLGYKPTPWNPLKVLIFNKMMSYFLSFNNRDVLATLLYESFGPDYFSEIVPINSTYQIPVVPGWGNFTIPLSINENENEISSLNNVDRDSYDRKNLIQACKEILNNKPVLLTDSTDSWINIGSNNWVVNGSKTTSGMPILCNDMHLPITLPHIWYEAHLISEEGLNIYGYTLAGTPIVTVGFNTNIAWGATIVAADSVDWYEYVWNNDHSQYWSRKTNSWQNPIETIIEIPRRSLTNHTEIIKFTEDGVILNEKGKTLAMKWIATQECTEEFLALYKANKASNWEEFNDSMQHYTDPHINIVFADKDGTISIRPTGKFIKRNYFGEGLLVQNGSDPSVPDEWEYIPFNEVPLSVNPEQFYLASANQKSVGPNYPYYITSFQAEGYRARAINRILSNADLQSIDFEFMIDAQCRDGGVLDTCAESFTPFFINALRKISALSSLEFNALNILEEWMSSKDKFLMKKELFGPTIFRQTFERFREFVWEDDYQKVDLSGVIRYPQDHVLEYFVRTDPNSHWFDNCTTTDVTEDRDLIIVKAFRQAIIDIRSEFGEDTTNWIYGNYHQLEISHLTGFSVLGKGPFPHDGTEYTLLAASGRKVDSGPSQRMIVDFGNFSNCLSVIPTGQSGHPLSKHYFDQFDLWYNCNYHPMFIQISNFENFPVQYVESAITLKPK